MNKFIIFLIAFITACSVSHSSYYNIEITGDASPDRKFEIAKEVAEKVWSGKLKTLIQEEIPELKGQDISKMLGIRWKKTVFNSFTDDEKEKTVVYVQCLFKSNSSDISNKALEICKKEVEAVLANYIKQ